VRINIDTFFSNSACCLAAYSSSMGSLRKCLDTTHCYVSNFGDSLNLKTYFCTRSLTIL